MFEINEQELQTLILFLNKQPYESAAPVIDFLLKKKQEHSEKIKKIDKK